MANYETCRKVVNCNTYAPDVVEAVVNRLMMLPEKMVQEFADNDWHIFITNGSIENHIGEREVDFCGGHIGGITVFEYRTIYIPIVGKTDRTFCAEFATIHEFGHYFDRSRGVISMGYDFQKIYNSEDRVFCANVGTAGNTNEVMEYFAESFACYYLKNDELKKYCPITYEYMDNIKNQYI